MATDEAPPFVTHFVRMPPGQPLTEQEAKAIDWVVHVTSVDGSATKVHPSWPTSVSLQLLSMAALRGDDPTAVIELFAECVRLGIFPPPDVLRPIASAFDCWLDSEGKADLTALLNLKGGRGRDPAFKRRLMQQRDAMVLQDVVRLTELGATQEQATEMVAARLEAEQWNHSRWDLGDLSADSLGAYLRRLDPGTLNSYRELARLANGKPDSVAAFLALFPPDAAPTFRESERKSAFSVPSSDAS